LSDVEADATVVLSCEGIMTSCMGLGWGCDCWAGRLEGSS
jgi:hypothetical protein